MVLPPRFEWAATGYLISGGDLLFVYDANLPRSTMIEILRLKHLRGSEFSSERQVEIGGHPATLYHADVELTERVVDRLCAAVIGTEQRAAMIVAQCNTRRPANSAAAEEAILNAQWDPTAALNTEEGLILRVETPQGMQRAVRLAGAIHFTKNGQYAPGSYQPLMTAGPLPIGLMPRSRRREYLEIVASGLAESPTIEFDPTTDDDVLSITVRGLHLLERAPVTVRLKVHFRREMAAMMIAYVPGDVVFDENLNAMERAMATFEWVGD